MERKWAGRATGLVLVMLLAFPDHTAAQIADTLHEQRVIGRRKEGTDEKTARFSPGQKIAVIDSAVLARYQQESVATLLTQQVPVFVKTYGSNGPSTVSFRGSSSAQSLVLWDGIPLQNAALGVTDLSLLPVGFTDRIRVAYGSSAGLWGSGNVGGALLLDSQLPLTDSARSTAGAASIGMGSFGRRQLAARLSTSGRRTVYSLRAFGETARNDFRYRDNQDSFQNLSHSALRWGGVMASMRTEQRGGFWGLSTWLQGSDREIPPALFESSSARRQRDAAVRLRADWRKSVGRNLLSAKLAYLYDRIHYDDDSIDLHSRLGVHKLFGELSWQRQLGHWDLLLFAPVQVSQLRLENDNVVRQQSLAMAGALRRTFFRNKLEVAGSLRLEHIDAVTILLPGLNAGLRLIEGLRLRANVQRTYRAPTLNERYYQPGGNAGLKPEQGWSFETGLQAQGKGTGWLWQLDGAAFQRTIKDWIIWFGGAIWTPHNIAVVQSQGLEVDGLISKSYAGWSLGLRGTVATVQSRTMESSLPGDGSIGKQIPYTPLLNGRAGITVSRRGWSASWSYAYTGGRFVNVDESERLAPYMTQHISLTVGRLPLMPQVSLQGRCDNLWNVRYSVVSGRPAPGRSIFLSLAYQLEPRKAAQ
jgi:iron complex outermembrane receptor protein